MKNFFMLFASAALLLSGGCKYDDADLWDAVDEHEARLKALEDDVKQINSDIDAINSIVGAIGDADWVTGVAQLPDGSGYTITFKKYGTVTVKNGTAGTAPVIGVTEIDGIHYWTVDGEVLKDEDGNPLAASPRNPTGTVIAPQVRINPTTFEWEISTDNGATWESTGVVAKGQNGTNGTSGDSLFSNVDTTSDPNSVTFTLKSNGATFTVPRYAAPSLTFTGLTDAEFVFEADGAPHAFGYTASTNVGRSGCCKRRSRRMDGNSGSGN